MTLVMSGYGLGDGGSGAWVAMAIPDMLPFIRPDMPSTGDWKADVGENNGRDAKELTTPSISPTPPEAGGGEKPAEGEDGAVVANGLSECVAYEWLLL